MCAGRVGKGQVGREVKKGTSGVYKRREKTVGRSDKRPQGRREELVTYLLGLYTPLDPPDAEVRLEEGEERMRRRRERRRWRGRVRQTVLLSSDALLAFR